MNEFERAVVEAAVEWFTSPISRPLTKSDCNLDCAVNDYVNGGDFSAYKPEIEEIKMDILGNIRMFGADWHLSPIDQWIIRKINQVIRRGNETEVK